MGFITTIAVLNIADRGTEVQLPENGCCLAIALRPHAPLNSWKIQEGLTFGRLGHHFTFNIECPNISSYKGRISKDELSRHGMTFRTMYL
ncbi:hypothetical protein HYPSUDRAFT_893633 [Hypholoma sublateritium FD-334 SS-4]|uniref:Uncharacterized protein n=1 Tax=Hypholoma sublateritium (strain FD-334 SS-4) TaxID=945553 RepID=A0A0D2NKE7_HYPSF|nr:hypothetical protein HYPSUDRAFT_893633 [Hypholoma sublateritium FD-334 SS-4]